MFLVIISCTLVFRMMYADVFYICCSKLLLRPCNFFEVQLLLRSSNKKEEIAHNVQYLRSSVLRLVVPIETK